MDIVLAQAAAGGIGIEEIGLLGVTYALVSALKEVAKGRGLFNKNGKAACPMGPSDHERIRDTHALVAEKGHGGVPLIYFDAEQIAREHREHAEALRDISVNLKLCAERLRGGDDGRA